MVTLQDLHYHQQDASQTHCCHADTNEAVEAVFASGTSTNPVYISDAREDNCERIWITDIPLFAGLVQLISGPESTFSQALGYCRSHVVEEYCLVDGQPVEPEDDPGRSGHHEAIAVCRAALTACHGDQDGGLVKQFLATHKK